MCESFEQYLVSIGCRVSVYNMVNVVYKRRYRFSYLTLGNHISLYIDGKCSYRISLLGSCNYFDIADGLGSYLFSTYFSSKDMYENLFRIVKYLLGVDRYLVTSVYYITKCDLWSPLYGRGSIQLTAKYSKDGYCVTVLDNKSVYKFHVLKFYASLEYSLLDKYVYTDDKGYVYSDTVYYDKGVYRNVYDSGGVEASIVDKKSINFIVNLLKDY